MCGPGSSVGIATDYGLDGPGLNPGGDEIFPPVQTGPGAHPASCKIGIARSKRDGTREETRFGLSAKRTSPFKLAGVSVQSTAGSRGVRISGQRLYRPSSDECKAAGYPLHSHLSPSLPHRASPCAIRFRTRYTGGKVRPGLAADYSPPSRATIMEDHPLGHTGPVTGSLYLFLYTRMQNYALELSQFHFPTLN